LGDRTKVRARLRLPLTVFALAALGILVAGLFLHRSMRDGARRRGAAEIDSVAALKAAAISAWRADAEKDAEFIATYPFVAEVASRGGDGLDPQLLGHAGPVLEHFASRHEYDRLAVLAPDGHPIVERIRLGGVSIPYDALLVGRALASSRPESALTANPDEGSPRLDIALAVRNASGTPLALVYSRQDAGPYLASVMGTWPVPSASAETVVVRPDGDAALFVTDPRYLKGWALRMRIPLSDIGRGVVRAARGEEGAFPAVDYRGTPLLIAARRIPGSDWSVATRMDLAEIEAPILRPALSIAALLVALLGACASALAFWWRYEVRQHRELADARDALAESEERFRLALAGSHYVWDWDLAAGRLSTDAQWAAEMGIPRPVVVGSLAEILASIVHADDLPEVKAQLEAHCTGDSPLFEAEFRMAETVGETRWALMRGRASLRDEQGRAGRVTGVVSDVTERRRLQVQLERSERMASLGTLAAGVAHEINNPLAYVLGNLDYLLAEMSASEPRQPELVEAAAQAREGAVRVRDVVRGLHVFSRPRSGTRAPADVADELAAAIRIADNEIRHRARLQVRLGSLPRVSADSHELGQVFLNILLNAAQAIPEGQAADNLIAVDARTDPSGWACVEIRDSGAGIPPHVLPRIFEPFFTTKPQGGGSGLGLATAHGIVSNAGGHIAVESQVGRGTSFRVLLPPAPLERTEDPANERAAPPPLAERPVKSARVLVIDDDPLVARTISRALGVSHQVITASSGAEALARLERREHFDVFLCDLMMPQMTGMDLHAQVSAMAPHLAERFVFITGGAFTDRAREFLARTRNPCVEKPFDFTQLRATIDRMAGQTAPGSAAGPAAP